MLAIDLLSKIVRVVTSQFLSCIPLEILEDGRESFSLSEKSIIPVRFVNILGENEHGHGSFNDPFPNGINSTPMISHKMTYFMCMLSFF